MSCPACGGDERNAIAPGYWLCRSIVVRQGTQLGPVPGTPPHLGIVGPLPVAWEEECGTEYHEKSGGGSDVDAMCACGTFAIGRCAECGDLVCGSHSALRGQHRLCLTDFDRADREETARAQAALADRARRTHQALNDAYLAKVMNRPNPIERVIAAKVGMNGVLLERDDATKAHLADRVRSSLPESRTREYDATPRHASDWSVDPTSLVRWLAGKRPPDWRGRKGRLRIGVRGWKIGEYDWPAVDYSRGSSGIVVLLTDGRVFHTSGGPLRGAGEPFRDQDLYRVGAMLGLR